MSITYTWYISSFERLKVKDSFSNVAAQVFGELAAEDDATGTKAVRPFSVKLDLSALDADTFISFESIDEATAIGWVNAVWGEEGVNAEKQVLADQLAEMLNTEFTNAPWIPAPITF